MSASLRLAEYADRVDRLKERFRYLGGARADTRQAGENARARLAWHEQLVADLRRAVEVLRKEGE